MNARPAIPLLHATRAGQVPLLAHFWREKCKEVRRVCFFHVRDSLSKTDRLSPCSPAALAANPRRDDSCILHLYSTNASHASHAITPDSKAPLLALENDVPILDHVFPVRHVLRVPAKERRVNGEQHRTSLGLAVRSWNPANNSTKAGRPQVILNPHAQHHALKNTHPSRKLSFPL